MRWARIAGVLILTAGTFFAATKSVPSLIQNSTSAEAAALAASEEQELLASQISDLQSELQGHTDRIKTLTAERDQFDQERQQAIALQEAAEAKLADSDKSDSTLVEQISTLTTENTRIHDQLSEAETELAELAGTLNDERGTVQALQDQIAVATSEADVLNSRIATLETVNAGVSEGAASEVKARLEEMNNTLEAAEQKITALTAEIDQHASTAAAMTSRATSAEGKMSALSAEIANLSDVISERDTEIAELRATEEESQADRPTISSCTATTTTIFAQQKLRFKTGTATIAEESVSSLEELIIAAQACADANLAVEIGGHTDSQGGELSNQTLSEERARAVFDFLHAGGVPSVAMRAVGFGESDPIADNSTSDGRSENRRITFDWQQK